MHNIIFWSRNLRPIHAPNQERNPKKQKNLTDFPLFQSIIKTIFAKGWFVKDSAEVVSKARVKASDGHLTRRHLSFLKRVPELVLSIPCK
jgi:hypothetical protein